MNIYYHNNKYYSVIINIIQMTFYYNSNDFIINLNNSQYTSKTKTINISKKMYSGILDLKKYQKLENLNCSNNNITKIINIPQSIKYINCSYNKISALIYLDGTKVIPKKNNLSSLVKYNDRFGTYNDKFYSYSYDFFDSDLIYNSDLISDSDTIYDDIFYPSHLFHQDNKNNQNNTKKNKLDKENYYPYCYLNTLHNNFSNDDEYYYNDIWINNTFSNNNIICNSNSYLGYTKINNLVFNITKNNIDLLKLCTNVSTLILYDEDTKYNLTNANCYESNFDVGLLPKNIKYLKFNNKFNFVLDNINCDLEKIMFGYSFNCPVDNLPNNLKYLCFGHNFNHTVDNLPCRVKILIFGYDFNQSVDNLPNSLEKIIFGYDFNQSINNLPNNLEYLTLSYEYNQNICKFPTKLKIIYLSDNNNKINKNNIPKNIMVIPI